MLIVKNKRTLVDIRFAGYIEFIVGITVGSRHSYQDRSLMEIAVFILCHGVVPVKCFKQLLAGISGIEFAFAIDWKVFHDNDIPLTMLSRMGSLNTARRLGFSDRGLLRPGMRADLMVVDTEKKRILRKDEMISRSHNTPFDGREILGEVMKTIVNGETLYDNGYFTR